MTRVAFVIPGDLASPTGGYGYDRRVLALLPDFGIEPTHVALPGAFPAPGPDDITETKRALAAIAKTTPLLVDGLAYGAMPADFIATLANPIIALVHHPLCLEAGLSPARAADLAATETSALALARHVVATSANTARILATDFGVPDAKITIAEPGTDPAPRSSGTGTPLQMLAVGTILPRKGYEILVEALKPLAALDWRLTIAGAKDRDAPAVAALEAAIAEAGFGDRIRLAGTVVPATLAKFYDTADVFVMPSLFEGYGMVLAEAMARGLPIVCTTGGAAAPDSAAIKVPPGDARALSQAIATVLENRKLRVRLADASWEVGRTLPPWTETTRRIAATILGLKA